MVYDNIFSNKGGNIMNTEQIKPEPMSEDQLKGNKNRLSRHD